MGLVFYILLKFEGGRFKMKSLKSYALIMLLVLGLVGGAYAALWSAQVEIGGYVETGEFSAEWTEFALRDEAYADSRNLSTYANPPEYTEVNVGIDPSDSTKAFIEIDNLYPRGPIGSTWDAPYDDMVAVSGEMTFSGSIPAVWGGVEIDVDDPGGVDDFLMVVARLGVYEDGDRSTWEEIAHTGAPGIALSGLEAWINSEMEGWDGQLEDGDVFTFGDETIYFYLTGSEAPMGQRIDFTMQFNWKQYNAAEYE